MNNKKGILKGRLLNFKEKKELTEKKEDFKKNSLKPLLLFALVALVSFSTGLLLSNKEKSNDNSQALNTFIKNYKSIKDNYYMELDEEELLKTALESIIESLDDPYSAVVDDSMSNSLNTKLQGSYSGFGIEIINEDNKIKIVGVISDSPAEKAKLAVGDLDRKSVV